MRTSRLSYFFSIAICLLAGLAFSYAAKTAVLAIRPAPKAAPVGSVELKTPIARKYIEPDSFAVPPTGKAIKADLSVMTVTLYVNGQIVRVLPILTIGKKGTAWETPRGTYRIETRERNHFSSIGRVYMPFSMQFNGNYFFHGETYYPGGQKVSANFSGGCIKLRDSDAEELFTFAELNTPVLIESQDEPLLSRASRWQEKPGRNATSPVPIYLAADAVTGEVLFAKNETKQVPIGSLSRLFTSLVTLDAINFFTSAKVQIEPDAALPAATFLWPGEKIQVMDLIYPLLFNGNPAAAQSLASMLGKDNFLRKLNDRARAMGLRNTVIRTPAGSNADLSTAEDLYRAARHIRNYKNFLWVQTLLPEKRAGLHRWLNENNLLSIPGVRGGLTGQTGSGEGGILIKEIAGRSVIIVVLQAPVAAAELAALGQEVETNFSLRPAP